MQRLHTRGAYTRRAGAAGVTLNHHARLCLRSARPIFQTQPGRLALMPANSRPAAPAGLGPAGNALWQSIVAVYELWPGELALLDRACRTTDVLERLDAELGAGSMVVKGSAGQPRANPALAAIAEHSRLLDVLLRPLALPQPGEDTGRRRSPQQVAAARLRWEREGGRRGKVA